MSRSASPPPDPAETTEEHSRGQVSAQATQRADRSARLAVTVFPWLIIAAALFGFFVPGPSLVLLPWVTILLGVIMFGMGLTLTVPDFALVARRPLPVLIGVVAQFVIMPLIGLGVSVEIGRAAGRVLVVVAVRVA